MNDDLGFVGSLIKPLVPPLNGPIHTPGGGYAKGYYGEIVDTAQNAQASQKSGETKMSNAWVSAADQSSPKTTKNNHTDSIPKLTPEAYARIQARDAAERKQREQARKEKAERDARLAEEMRVRPYTLAELNKRREMYRRILESVVDGALADVNFRIIKKCSNYWGFLDEKSAEIVCELGRIKTPFKDEDKELKIFIRAGKTIVDKLIQKGLAVPDENSMHSRKNIRYYYYKYYWKLFLRSRQVVA